MFQIGKQNFLLKVNNQRLDRFLTVSKQIRHHQLHSCFVGKLYGPCLSFCIYICNLPSSSKKMAWEKLYLRFWHTGFNACWQNKSVWLSIRLFFFLCRKGRLVYLNVGFCNIPDRNFSWEPLRYVHCYSSMCQILVFWTLFPTWTLYFRLH